MVELIYKFGMLIAAVGAVIGVRMKYAEFRLARHGHLREEYRFAREFMADLMSPTGMHPFLKQKGYQAIACDARLSATEIEYLLNLDDAPRALEDYVLGRSYLEHKTTAVGAQIAFKQKYERPWSRNWRKGGYILIYVILFGLAGLPVLIPAFDSLQPLQKLVTLLISVAFFVPLAFLPLEGQFRVIRAEALVKSQRRRPG